MSLFGRGDSGEKADAKAAGQAEVARLKQLSARDLAVAVIAVVGTAEEGGSNGLNELQIATSLMAEFKSGASATVELREPVREAVLVLENAGLLARAQARGGGWLTLTKEGREALAAGDVVSRLAD